MSVSGVAVTVGSVAMTVGMVTTATLVVSTGGVPWMHKVLLPSVPQ